MSDSNWKKLGSRYLVREKWATLRVDECELPNGIIKDDYYVLEYPDWANAVAITKNNTILLVKQYRHAGDIISLELPGGVIDEGESPSEAIHRELLEETGYQFESIEEVCSLYTNPATANNKIHTFLLKGGIKIQEQKLDEHEFLQVEEYTMAEFKQLLFDKKIAQGLHCAGIFYALMQLGEIKETP